MQTRAYKVETQKTTAWAGGATTELFLWPEGASYQARDFLWRLSTARIDQSPSVFTSLPAYERILIPLTGELTLAHEGGAPFTLERFHAHRFDGAWDTVSVGCVRDFNLMLQKGRAKGHLEALHVTREERVRLKLKQSAQHFQAAYCFEGSARIHWGEESLSLASGELMLLEQPPGELALLPQNGAAATLLLAEIQIK